MAGGLSFNMLMFIAIMVASMHFNGAMSQTRHVVGDTLGWIIPPGGAAAYTAWASQQTFTVGDILVFNFTNGEHDVAEVSAAGYDPCTSTNPITLITTGPALITLITPGPHYYICTFTSHCQIGQKLAINVSTSAASPPSTTPSTPSAPPTTTPPSMTPTTLTEPCPPTSSPSSSPLSPPTFTSGNIVPLPSPSSGSSSFTTVVSATFLAVGLAFLS